MVVRRLLAVAGVGPRADAEDVEIAVLRRRLTVLRRQVARPRYTRADRMLLATLARLLSRDRWSAFLVTPATLLRWHRDLVCRRWAYPDTRVRRGLDEQAVGLVLRLARENPRWGCLRIVGEARKLGVRVAATSVRNILRRHRLEPAPRRGGPTWGGVAARVRRGCQERHGQRDRHPVRHSLVARAKSWPIAAVS